MDRDCGWRIIFLFTLGLCITIANSTLIDTTSVDKSERANIETTLIADPPSTRIDTTSVDTSERANIETTLITEPSSTPIDTTSVDTSETANIETALIAEPPSTRIDTTSVDKSKRANIETTLIADPPSTRIDITSVDTSERANIETTLIAEPSSTLIDTTSVDKSERANIETTLIAEPPSTHIDTTSVDKSETPNIETTLIAEPPSIVVGTTSVDECQTCIIDVTSTTRLKTTYELSSSPTPTPAVPSEPQYLHSYNTYVVPGTVELWWNQPARPNGIIQYYEVQYVGNETTAETDQENGFFQILSISVIHTNVYILNLIPSSTYSFRVRAVTSIGPGEFTPFISQTTRPLPPETIQVQTKTSTSLLIEWQPPSQPHGSILQYGIRYQLLFTPNRFDDYTFYYPITLSVNSTETSVYLRGLEPYSDYQICVFTRNEVYTSSYSCIRRSTLEDVPSPPVNVSATALDNTTLSVFWDLLNPNGIIVDYKVEYMTTTLNTSANSSDVKSVTTTKKQVTLTDLTYLSMYIITVVARTSVGEGNSSSEVVTLMFNESYFPLFNITVLDKTATSLTVEWDSSVHLNNITGYYQIRYRGISSENSVSGSFYDVMEATVDINSMVYEITSLEPYSEYEISVSVLDKYTSVLSRTLESVPSSAPRFLKISSIGNTTFLLTWEPPDKANGIITYYQVYYSGQRYAYGYYTAYYYCQRDYFSNTITINGNTLFNLSNLNSSWEYYIDIRAGNNIGLSYYSSYVNERTLAGAPDPDPLPPIIVTVNNTANTLQVEWQSPLQPAGVISFYEATYRGVSTRNLVNETFYQTANVLVNATTLFEIDYSYSLDCPTESITLSGLEPYSVYKISIIAVNNHDFSSNSSTSEIRTLQDVPSAPVNVSLSVINNDTLLVTWDPPLRPNGIILYYEIHKAYSIDSQSTEIYYNVSMSTHLFITGNSSSLSNCTIRVRAATSVGLGSFAGVVSNVSRITSEPQNLYIYSYGVGTVYFRWYQPARPNGIIQYYEVQYVGNETTAETDQENGFSQILSISVIRTYVYILYLIPSSTYSFRVRAVTSIGPGEFTPFISQTTRPLPPKTIQVQTKTSTSLLLEWQPPPQPHGSILQYGIRYQILFTPNRFDDYTFYYPIHLSVNSTETSVYLRGLEPYSDYQFCVRTQNEVYTSSNSICIERGTFEDVPSPPVNVRATAIDNTTLSVFWDLPLNPNGIIVDYKVEYMTTTLNTSANSSDVKSVTTTKNQVTLKGLTYLSMYIITVVARTSVGEGNSSSEVVTLMFNESYFRIPLFNITVLDKTATSLTVEWDSSVHLNNITGYYQIRYRGISSENSVSGSFYDVMEATVDINSMVYKITSLEPYSEYEISVSVLDKYTSVLSRTLESVPSSAPRFLKISSIGNTSLLLTWEPPDKPNGIITYYQVYYSGQRYAYGYYTVYYYCQSDSFSNTITINGNTSFNLSNLNSSWEYSVNVRAGNNIGLSYYSSYVTGRTLAGAPLPPIIVTVVNNTANTLQVEWQSPLQPAGGISFYEVTYRGVSTRNLVNETFYQTGNVTYEVHSVYSDYYPCPTESITLSGLEPYSVYKISVIAVNNHDFSSDSSTTEIRTLQDVPSAPVNVSLSVINNDTLLVTWDPPLRPNGIILYYEVHKVYSTDSQSTEIYYNITMSTHLFITGNSSSLSNCTIRVRAATSVGLGSWSFAGVVSNVSRITSEPQNLYIYSYGVGTVYLRWYQPARPNGIIQYYEVQYVGNETTAETDQENGFSQISSISAIHTNVYIFNLIPSSTYIFRVRAVTSIGPGEFTPFISQTTYLLPPKTIQVQKKTSTSLLVEWQPPPQPHGSIIQYGIRYYGLSTPNRVDYTFYHLVILRVNATETSVYLSGLEPYSDYQICVYTRNEVYTRSNYICITRRTLEDVPSPPVNVRATAIDNTTLSVFWDLPLNPNGIIVDYKVEYMTTTLNTSANSSDVKSVTTTKNQVTLTDLTYLSMYIITVVARTSVGEGNSSSEVVTLMFNESYFPLINITVLDKTATSLTVEWDSSVHLINITRYYQIRYRGISSENSVSGSFYDVTETTVDINSMVYTITSLEPYSEYEISVSVLDKYTSVLSRTLESVPSSAPRFLKISSISNTSLLLTWEPPDKPNGIITHYQVDYSGQRYAYGYGYYPAYYYCQSDSFSNTITINGNISFNLSNLNSSWNYNFHIRAGNNIGLNHYSRSVNGRTLAGAPSPPINVTVVNNTANTLQVEWQSPLQTAGGISFYEVTYRGVSTRNLVNETFYQTANVTYEIHPMYSDSYPPDCPTESITLSGLEPYSVYKISVIAVNIHDFSSNSSTTEIRTLQDVPSAPVNVSLSLMNNDTLLVTWEPPLRPNGIILYYEVHKAYSTDSQSTEIYYNITTSMQLFITGNNSSLSNCTIRVRAATSVGPGSWSFAGVVNNVSRKIPRIVSNNGTSVSVSRNDSIVLSFSITQAVPPVTPDNIVWTITNSSGTFDLGSGEGDNYVFSEDRLTLRIQRARRVDAGTYSVDVSNAVGTASAEITLMVTGVSPQITTPLRNTTVVEGQSLILTCPAVADPSPVFVWRFRGERISTIANKYEIVSNNSVSTLTVVGVGGSDEGDYNCSVSNRFGPDSTSAFITILGPPTFLLTPSKFRDVVEGEVLTVECQAFASPPPSIIWMKESSILNISTSESVQDRVATSRLVISNFSLSDAGEYSCVAMNEIGNTSSPTFTVDIVVRPTISVIREAVDTVFHDGQLEREEGSTITLQCTASGLPQPSIQWLRNEAILQGDGTRVTVTSTPDSENGGGILSRTSSLYFTRLELSDAAQYSCRAVSGFVAPIIGQNVWQFDLFLKAFNNCDSDPCQNGGSCIDGIDDFTCICTDSSSGYYAGKTCSEEVTVNTPPTITQGPEDKDVALFSSVTLSCLAEGNPEPLIQWYKDDKPLDVFGQAYTINSIQPNDRGFYHCRATSIAFSKIVNSTTASILIKGLIQQAVTVDLSSRRRREQNENSSFIEEVNALLSGMELTLQSGNGTLKSEIISVSSLPDAPDNVLLVTTVTDTDQSTEIPQLSTLLAAPLREVVQEASQVINQPFQVSQIVRFDGCPAEEIPCGNIGGVYWPETEIGGESRQPCPCGISSTTFEDLDLVATRECIGDFATGAIWSNTECFNCNLTGVTRALCELVNIDSGAQLASALVTITDNTEELRTEDVALSADLLEVIPTSEIQEDDRVTLDILGTVDQLASAPQESIRASQQNTNSSSRLLDILQTVTKNVPLVENETLQFVGESFGLQVQTVMVDPETPFVPDLSSIADSIVNNSNMRPPLANIALPGSAIPNSTALRVSAALYTDATLFQQRNNTPLFSNETEVGSAVVSFSIIRDGQQISDLEEAVTIALGIMNDQGYFPRCTFWNFSLDRAFGAWDNSGCDLINSTNNYIVCECDHLTNFAILLDIFPDVPGPTDNLTLQNQFLTAVSYIGTSISIICLILTIVTYLADKTLRQGIHKQLLINLCVALTGLYATFIVSTFSMAVWQWCIVISALMQYFFLATFFWMTAEAINLYRKLVQVFKPDIKNYIAIAMATCWVVPAFIVAFSLAPRYQNYFHQNFCRVYDYSFYFGVIIPFGLVYIFNWVTFIVIMVSLSSRPNLKKEGSKKANYRKLKENLWVAMGLSILFGLGWGIGLLATTGLPSFIHIIFEWAFTIMTAFQGLIIFILYCLRAAEVRKVWKRILCCESKRPKHSLEPSSSGWTGTLATKITTLGRRTSQSLAKRFAAKKASTIGSTETGQIISNSSIQESKTEPSSFKFVSEQTSSHQSHQDSQQFQFQRVDIHLQPAVTEKGNTMAQKDLCSFAENVQVQVEDSL